VGILKRAGRGGGAQNPEGARARGEEPCLLASGEGAKALALFFFGGGRAAYSFAVLAAEVGCSGTAQMDVLYCVDDRLWESDESRVSLVL